MSKTIVAIYDDITAARQVVEDLVKADFARSTISLITNDAQNQYGHYLDEHYTARDDAVTASEGAGFGAVVGGLTGALVGLAALTIPGIGLAIAAGPIVAVLTGTIAGAVTGGVVGALVKSGVPEDEAPYYAEGIRRGGTLVSVETSDTLRAEDILNRYGSINIHERSNVWRQAGWQGIDAAVDRAEPALTSSDISNVPTVMPVVNELPDGGMFATEPLHSDHDTPKSNPVATPATDPDFMPIPDVVVTEQVPAEGVLLHQPDRPTLEEDLNRTYEYTVDDLQRIEPITQPSSS